MIGAGVVGSLLQNAGYYIYLYDIDLKRMNLLKEKGKYTVKRFGKDDVVHVTVTDFTPITVEDELVEKITKAPIVFCCVYGGAFESTCRNLSKAIEKRAEEGGPPFNIVLCVNALGAPEYFKKTIGELLAEKEHALTYFTSKVGLEQALVMIAGISVEFTDDGVVYSTALEGDIDIDGDVFLGNLDIPHMVLVDRAQARMLRKIYTGNMLHAMFAFMGNVRGYQYISQSQSDPEIADEAIKAFDEADAAMAAEYGFEDKDRKAWKDRLVSGMGNQNIKDPIPRVVANSIEKLSRTNRFIAPALLCMKHGIKPEYLARGIAYGLMYDNPDDGDSRIIKRYITENGIDEGIRHFCGLVDEEKELRELIAAQYLKISAEKPGK
jgi:mannitol-1-phosphate 5-dehydrogenase